MESILDDVLPRNLPHPTQLAPQYQQIPINAPGTSFPPPPVVSCVPDVSLLDPNEIVRPNGEERISYKLWRKHKTQQNVQNQQQTIAAQPIPQPIPMLPLLNAQPSRTVTPVNPPMEDVRITELAATVERQQEEIGELRNENATLKRDFSEMKQNFDDLFRRVEEMNTPRPQPHINHSPRGPPLTNINNCSGRWSLPDNSEVLVESRRFLTPNKEPMVQEQNNTGGRLPPDKSQMINNLFKKYFPDNVENTSPTNRPIFEFNEEEKSIATFNYLNKYRLNASERVLDISKLKRQSKLGH